MAALQDKVTYVLMERQGRLGRTGIQRFSFSMSINNPAPDRPGQGGRGPRGLRAPAARLLYDDRDPGDRPAARRAGRWVSKLVKGGIERGGPREESIPGARCAATPTRPSPIARCAP